MYFVRIRGNVFGPLEERQVVDMVRQGKLGRMNEISTDNRQWVRADELEQFFPKSKPKPKPRLFDALELPTDDAPDGDAQIATQQSDAEQASSDSWYYSDDGKTGLGPFPQSEIEQMIRQGKITGQTILWHDRLDPLKAEAVAEFARHFRKTSKSAARRTRNLSQFQQASDDAPVSHGDLAPELLRQLERAGTWSLVLALMATTGAAVLLISQLFHFVLIVNSGSVMLTLGFLLVALVTDTVAGYMVFTFWRYTNQLRRASHEADDVTLTLAVRRMAEFWRACVLAPIIWCVFALLVTLLAFALGLNSITGPFREMQHIMQSGPPVETPADVMPIHVPPPAPLPTPSEQPADLPADPYNTTYPEF